MKLEKRNCGIKIRLAPYGGGWTDVYADFGDGELYFIISYISEDSFETLMKALYHLYPENCDPEDAYGLLENKIGVCEYIGGEYVTTRIANDIEEKDITREIPWKASFSWNAENSYSNWTLERIPNEATSFMLKISIDVCSNETAHYEYEVPYADMCYAVAAACTETIKTHGFWGYHYATYNADMNLRYLLFLKSIGLGNMEARELTFYDEQGKGESSSFNKEIDLLLFDM